MKYLITIFLLVPGLSFSQVVIDNKSSKDVEEFVKQGLHQLKIDSIYVRIVDLTPELDRKMGGSSHKINAVTMQHSKGQYMVLIGDYREVSLETLVAHELIHIQQRYEGKDISEGEAFTKQVLLAQRIRNELGNR